MMVLGRFSAPWDEDPAWTDLDDLARSKLQSGHPTLVDRAFIEVLQEVATAYEALDHPSGEDPRTCRAQLILGLATTLARQEPEQWAVRWLDRIGRPYLRQWWRHAAADRRIAAEARLAAPLTALVSTGSELLTGDQAGRVQRHDASPGLLLPRAPLARLHKEVWSIAARNGTVVAGGAGNELFIDRSGNQKVILLGQAAVTAVATDGQRVAWGFETGKVWLEDAEVTWPDGRAEHPAILALTFTADSTLLCVRADGEIAEHRGDLTWRQSHVHGKRVRVAQWHPSAEMVALGGVDGSIAVLSRSAGTWHTKWLAVKHLSVAAVGWSADGCLASAGYDRRIWVYEGVDDGEPRYKSLRSASPTSVLAFTDRLLISGHGRRLIAWHRSTGRGGRALTPPDEVTVVGLNPNRPEVMASATSWGSLRQHDSAGRIRHDPVVVRGRVHRLAPARDGWYVAASAGLYHWLPGRRLDKIGDQSRVVAAGADGSWVAGCGDRVLVNGHERFRHTTTVVDALIVGNGSVITLDDHGELRIDGMAVESLPPGRRLLAAEPESGAVLLLSVTDGTVYRYDGRRTVRLWSAGQGFTRAVAMTPEILAVAHSDGELAVVRASTGARIAGGHLHASALAGDGGRLAAAAGDEVSLFSLVMPGSSHVADDLQLRVGAHASTGRALTYMATMPDGSRWPMAADMHRLVARLIFQAQEDDDLRRDLPLHAAERLKGWLDAAGLRLAADRLVSQDAPLPARLRLVISDPDLHFLPWELAVDQRLFRVVRTPEATVPRAASFAADGVRLLTLRALGDEFETFGRIYSSILDRFPRGLELQADEVPPVASEPELAGLLGAPADVIVLLAHAGPRHLRLAPGQAIGTERAAELLAAATPQLVVLAACQSVNLARSLADRGVPAVIGLRTRASVWALEQLLEELLVNLMSGEAVEDGFAAALHACIRLPGTSAPVLYMHPDAPRPFILVPSDTGN